MPKQELVNNDYDLSLSKYKVEIYEEVIYQSPKEIIKKLSAIESKINNQLLELKELV